MHDVHFSNDWWRKGAKAAGSGDLTWAQRQAVNIFTREHLIGLELQRIDCMAIYHYAAEDAATAVVMRKNPKFPQEVFGFGGVVADFQGSREEDGRAPWIYFMHYANLDNVPEARGRQYPFDLDRTRATAGGKLIDVTAPPWLAVGDGVADDTAALNHALNAAARHGTVYLPPGQYKITAPLIVPPGVELCGPLGTGKARDARETCTLAV